MAEEFNPYYVWLGIPPAEQPPNYYRLLGITLFETSTDVIDGAADRQTAHLRTFQTGKNSDLSQRLLNEVAAARVCLLDLNKRAAYDAQLRSRMAAAARVATPIQPARPATSQPANPDSQRLPSQPQRRPTAATPAAATPVPPVVKEQPEDQWDDLLGPAKQSPMVGNKFVKSLKADAKRESANRMIMLGAVVGIVLLGAIGFAIFSQTYPSKAMLVFNWSDAERVNVSVSIDDLAVAVPATGPWEHACLPGSHHVVAQRPNYKLDEKIAVAAGERLNVPSSWSPKAVLALHWQTADRTDAALHVDGQPRVITANEPLEIAVEPGRHRVEITRPGTAPYSTTSVVMAGQRETVIVLRLPKEATMVLDWPADQRQGAEVTVDGGTPHEAVVPKNGGKLSGDASPQEITTEPGHHALRIARPGFEPFTTEVDLVAGLNRAIKPVWVPEQPKVTDASKPTETEALVQPPKKYPIPSAAELAEASKQLDEIYQLGKPSLGDIAKAQQLIDVASRPGSSVVERYTLFAKAAEKALGGGDVALAMQAVELMAGDYDIDALGMKQEMLGRFVAVAKPDKLSAAIPIAEQMIDQALSKDQYERAIALCTIAGKAATRGQFAARKETEDRLALKRKDLEMMNSMAGAAKQAEARLLTDPADAVANLTLGRWRCLYKSDWASGLPLLAKASDEKFKAAAEAELKSPTDPDLQVMVADTWWNLGKAESSIARYHLRYHAAEIYRAAIPNLTSTLKKKAIEKRLADVNPLPRAATPPTIQRDVRYLAELSAEDVSVLMHPHSGDAEFGFKGTVWPHSIWAHPPAGNSTFSHLAYQLDARYRSLAGEVGIGGVSITPASALTFRIAGDGKTLWQSKPIQAPGIAVPFRVDITKVKRLELFVSCAGPYDGAWAWWIEPVLESKGTIYASSNSPGSRKSGTAGRFPIGEWVDVLSLIDTKRDAVSGEWTRVAEGIISNSPQSPRITIPVLVDGNYDLEVEFTRTAGAGDVGTIFSIGAHSSMLSLSAFNGQASGLLSLNGRSPIDPAEAISVRPGNLQNNRRYRELLRIQNVSPNVGRFNVSLDGKPYLPAWSGDPTALNVHPNWGSECPRGLALCGPNVKFHSARLRLNSGNASSTVAPPAE